MIELAKQALDVGLFTNDRQGLLDFWQQQVELEFSELLPLGGGLRQHRHAIGDSVLKINHSREPLPDAPASGIRRLIIARPGAEAVELTDPDGNRVRVEPPGEVEQIRVELTVSALARHQDFYGGALGLRELDDTTFQCGVSQIHLGEGDAVPDSEQRARGYRYMTIQVFDVRACHREILQKGGREGRAPIRLGDVAHISFVRDPDGNWIEVSQRKSLTGSLD